MALQAAYTQFLSAPNSSALAADATLHYITTTISVSGANDMIKHFGTLRNQVKKKKEHFLHVVEGSSAIVVEVETVLEFVLNGGAYLPGLDDNFLTDRTVTLPVIHVVTFDSACKIVQIRQSWDQGSLLKQLDVIGRTGRNWPIRDSKEQIRLIARCAGTDPSAYTAGPSSDEVIVRSRGNSNTPLRDPHASLSLFAPREETESVAPAVVVSPYAGARPRQRGFVEILGDEPVEEPNSPRNGRQLDLSPNKTIAPKMGAGKIHPNRLFEGEEEDKASPENTKSPERFYRPDPKKFQHFDFADGSDPADAPQAGVPLDKKPKTKRDSNWSFEDFVTPQKATATRGMHRARDVRHWGTDDGAVDETPAKKQPQSKARRDAEAHFELVDDGLPTGEPRNAGRPRGANQNSGLGLYDNNLYNEDGSAPTPQAQVLGNITNMKDRRKDFDPHFKLTDESPNQGVGDNVSKPKIGDDRQKAVRMMESNWAAYDESPTSQKENNKTNTPKETGEGRGITIAGDGMGGKKRAGRAWAIGDEPVTGRGIMTAGDGMGGKKGGSRGWAIGDESDEEQVAAVKPKVGAAQKSSSFWDF